MPTPENRTQKADRRAAETRRMIDKVDFIVYRAIILITPFVFLIWALFLEGPK